eukprot:TRINITY_DN309_c0_g1_i1.p1 TRINITY_DN309_c0_g1~~TRINITY_DN309_c0_g1_i1.p1  ORF type:complete len:383 (+),score=80.42 TRINITY_DN309_c0_g1_i1:68-1216(+)
MSSGLYIFENPSDTEDEDLIFPVPSGYDGCNSPNIKNINTNSTLNTKTIKDESTKSIQKSHIVESVKPKVQTKINQNLDNWYGNLLPELGRAGKTPNKIVEIIRKEGIPSEVRSSIWPLLLGNPFCIGDSLFEICKTRGQSIYEKSKNGQTFLEALHPSKYTSAGDLKIIDTDIPRTCSSAEMKLTAEQDDHIRQLLFAFVAFRPDVGYTQGLTYLVFPLALNLRPNTAFQCLISIILKSPILLTVYRRSDSGRNALYRAFYFFFENELKDLFQRMRQLDLLTHFKVILERWFMTLFKTALDDELSMWILDWFFTEGDIVLFKAALSLLKYHKNFIMNNSFEDSLQLLGQKFDDIEHQPLLDNMPKKIKPEQFSNVLASYGF